MKRKKFIKNMMSVGIGRNAANWAAQRRCEVDAIVMARIMSQPGVLGITNVIKTKEGIALRVKRYVV